ncbi:MAG: HU family DNA-binding protein [Muribaculaceae bacterium]|nr:HU family DNA-binding protein [Muribaculaceae bacterium]
MNTKITLPKLVSLLVESTGKSKRNCEDFLRVFFSTISDSLADGETVKVKGLGVFKVITVEARKSVNVATGGEYIIPEHKKISFLPAKSLATAINAPFEIFETVEVNDNISDSELLGDEPQNSEFGSDYDNIAGAEEVFPETNSVNTKLTPITDDIATVKEKQELIEDIKEEGEMDSRFEEQKNVLPTMQEENIVHSKVSDKEEKFEESEVIEDEAIRTAEKVRAENNGSEHSHHSGHHRRRERVRIDMEYAKKERNRSFAKGFFMGLGAAIILLILSFGIFYHFITDKMEKIVNSEKISLAKPEVVDVVKIEQNQKDAAGNDKGKLEEVRNVKETEEEIEVPDTRPSDEMPVKGKKVYDTISETRYLTTIAKEHYGNYQLWPYIYEENKNILGHPDRIRPGTRVVVPPLSKYGVDAKSKADIKKAVAKGLEIYAMFNKDK